jgi:type I restriction enzyme S subunit
MKYEKLGNVVDIIAGQSPPSSTYNNIGDGIPFFQGKTDYGDKYPTVRFWCTEPTKISLPEDILISMRAPVGPVNINVVKSCIGRGLSAIRVKSNTNRDYIYYWLKQNQRKIAEKETGTTFKAITQKKLAEITIPFPDYKTQSKIARVLFKIEFQITQRIESLRLLDEYLTSIFLEMFGDPGLNKQKWNKATLKELALRFSDGPFGSNLKTEHYSNKGIQVIRLQNIGVNQFLEKDISFVKTEHYENVLKKFRCHPGDVIIATMGSPNIRACIVPQHVKIAINKADCVLLRVNPESVNQFYISHLINQKGFLSLTGSFIHGQTRARIASGQLAKILIPIPPIELQNHFAQIVERTESLKEQYKISLQELENLYGSLSQKAFRGELKIN